MNPCDGWWRSATAIQRANFRDLPDVYRFDLRNPDLDGLVERGIDVLEVFAPAESGNGYHGLAVRNHRRIDPRYGDLDDFRRLVDGCHTTGLRVITFDNLGYCDVDAPHFEKACDDAREGRDTMDSRRFLWADREDAPPPRAGNSVFLVRPNLTGYDPMKSERWVWSERARHYYWTRWKGHDKLGVPCRYPQYDWGDDGWREDAIRITEFWLATGIDGMVVDAPNWYVGLDWPTCRRLAQTIAPRFAQPEGAGGFGDDPVAWIEEGAWSCVQDYGLGVWWEPGSDVVRRAIECGDPSPIEGALRNSHDRIAAAGGVLYWPPPVFDDERKSRLALAACLFVGTVALFETNAFADAPDLLGLRRRHPALGPFGGRRALPARSGVYTFLRTTGSSRLLVTMNFRSEPTVARTDLSGVHIGRLKPLLGDRIASPLPPYGIAVYEIEGD